MRHLQWCTRRAAATAAVLLLSSAAGASAAHAESGDARWIWSPEHQSSPTPEGAAFFRKTFSMGEPESGRVQITGDDRYELYVNGRRVGAGNDWRRLDDYDILPYLRRGKNVIAVKAENLAAGSAGLVALVTVKNRGNTDVAHSTDSTWRVSLAEAPNWRLAHFDHSDWQAARVLGELGSAEPWGDQVRAPSGAGVASGRFTLPDEFRVQRVVGPDDTGSLIAMTFDERGDVIASREKGPLLRISDKDGDGIVETVTTYCDKMQNCQGILALNGDVFAVGDGPDGTSFCRLSDEDGDGAAEAVNTLFKFKGGMGEHGPHAPVLGPDGLIYLVIGNHASVDMPAEPSSPHHHYYEGDLLKPRYEDAGGHAVGVKVPGGVVVRTDLSGSFVELYAGGFRNAYDIVFNGQGDLFSYDSDMEWDVGLPWYRPTRVNHVIPGAEFGWRSGWAKWPEYYLDSLPATVDVGRGSPTGVECYNHRQFPVRYHNALFIADWSLGRILAVKMKPAEGTYRADAEVFLEGRPLNVTDLAVGPDGWLYFSTGGRGTEGGLYRIVWSGKVPPAPVTSGIARAILEPQLGSAYGRNNVAKIKQELGDQWSPQLAEVADNTANPVDARLRAMDIMQLIGPPPSTRFLLKLSNDADAQVRAKAAYLMGIHFDEQTHERLVELLDDEDPAVRRKACESAVRTAQLLPVEKLVALLDDPYRFVRWAARRALERSPRDTWQPIVLDHPKLRVFLEGATAMLILAPERDTIDLILARAGRALRGDMSDEDFVGLLRVVQLAVLRGEIEGDAIADLRSQLADEYPAFEPRMNRELVRLLVYLKDTSFLARAIEELNGQSPLAERLHLAAHLRFVESGWQPEWQLALLRFYEDARQTEGGNSYGRYLDNLTKDFFATLSPELHREVLALGEFLPSAAMLVLPELPEELDATTISGLIELDRRLQESDTEAAELLSRGMVALLARCKDPAAMAYLREAFETQPERRVILAMGLAQEPGGENWPLLVGALPILEDAAAIEVAVRLQGVDRSPEEAEALRQAIMLGLRLDDEGAAHVIALLQKWTGEQVSEPEHEWDVALAAWQSWFAEHYPDAPPAELPVQAAGARWSEETLLDFLANDGAHAGDPDQGKVVFEKAQCVKCHRFGTVGEGIGPDLTTVARRFQTREIVQSVIYPSLVISDQYASKTVITDDGRTFTGIVGAAGEDAVVVLQANGEKVTLENDAIDEIVPSPKSAMPDGLFDELSLEEIADLFALLRTGAIVTAGR